jgi:metal-responsive CopG/Arc/MetJ family transcriptional regulator
MALQGEPSTIKKFANHALGAKGVKHGDLVMTTMGSKI